MTDLRPRGLGAALLLAISLTMAWQADAQEPAETERAALMIEQARDYYGTKVPLQDCNVGTAWDEIVVCGHRRPDPRYERVEPLRPSNMKTIALGAPPAGGGVGIGMTVRGCFLQKCPKQLYFIDLKSIPEPAPGSDAYLIAKGEMPAR